MPDMDADDCLKQFGLVPSDEALPTIRALLDHEAELERTGGERADDLALLCCVQLFSRGLLEDILRIWDAKQSGFDLACYLDVQFLCGAGLLETKRYLSQQEGEKASAALKYLQDCEAAGDFEDFSPARHLAHYASYFG